MVLTRPAGPMAPLKLVRPTLDGSPRTPITRSSGSSRSESRWLTAERGIRWPLDAPGLPGCRSCTGRRAGGRAMSHHRARCLERHSARWCCCTPQCQERPEQSDAGPEALCPVCVDSVLTDDVVKDTGHRRLQVAVDEGARVVSGEGDTAVEHIVANHVIADQVGGGAELVGQQAGAAGGAVSAWDT